jgi:beta-lactamase class A
MQSVFKFHIALAVLSQIDKGKFSFDQKIEILKKDLLPGLYSPVRDKYPDGATLAISEILEYMVSASDNVCCEVLLRLIGGPRVVEEYFIKNNFKDVSIKFNEEEQQHNWDFKIGRPQKLQTKYWHPFITTSESYFPKKVMTSFGN